jgi:WD domain, G-beta repeat/WD40-like Beta Propeller Repeat
MSAVKTGLVAVVSSLVVVAVVALIMPDIVPPLQESYYDLGDGLRLKRIRTLGTASFGEAGGVAWSPDGLTLAAYGKLGTRVTIWSIEGKKLNEFGREGNGPYVGGSIAFLRDGRAIVTPAIVRSQEDHRYSLSLWGAEDGKLEQSVGGPWPDMPWTYNLPYKFALSSDGESVATVSVNPPPVAVLYSTRDWLIRQRIEDSGSNDGTSVAFSPDGRLLAIGRRNGELSLADLTVPEVKQTRLRVYEPGTTISVGALAFSPDGEFLATGGHFDANLAPGQEHDPVKIWRISDRSLAASFSGDPISVVQLSWSASGRYLAAAMANHKLRIFLPAASQKFNGVADFRDQPVNSVSFSPDGQKLAASIGGSIGIFSLSGE